MSIINVDKIGPVGGGNTITVAAGIASYTGKINCPEFDNNPSFTGNVTIAGNLGVAGTITYEDVDRVDATGISTFREGFGVGPLTGIALTAYKDGSIRSSGIITASSFSGSGTNLTSIPSAQLTGALPAISGASLTGINTAFGSGTSVNTTGIGTFAGLDSTSGQIINKNIVINGNFQVNQRGTSANNGNGIYSTDRWGHYYGSTDVTTWTQRVQTTTPGPDAPAGEGHRQYFEVVKNVAGGTGAAGWSWFAYKIEAQDLACSGWDHKSATSYLTLSFWVRQSAASQLFYGALRTDDGTDYDYTFSYTADSTWRKISVTIPGNTNLTLNNDTGLGATLFFYQWLGTDATTSGHTLNTWATAAGANRCPDMASGWINSTAWFRIAGVQLEVGPVATPFEHKSYQDELARCQRYYFRDLDTDGTTDLSPGVYACTYQNNHKIAMIWLPVPMRITPTMTATWVNGTYNVAKSSNTRMEGYFSSSNSSNNPIHSTSIKCVAEL